MMSDWGLFARAVVALAIVLALMAAATWIARRYLVSGGLARVGGQRRLAVVEQTVLDGKTRLMLVRRDNVEHLLVLGPAGAVVVESAIRSAAATTAASGAPGSQAGTESEVQP